jgi:hypothetical protein
MVLFPNDSNIGRTCTQVYQFVRVSRVVTDITLSVVAASSLPPDKRNFLAHSRSVSSKLAYVSS